MTETVAIYQVHTSRESRPVVGTDSTILAMPTRFYVAIGDGPPALALKPFARFLRRLAEALAANIGEELHHAQFAITTDPAVVERYGSIHDCATCRAGTDQALAVLRERPDQELLVGQLWWAGSSEEAE